MLFSPPIRLSETANGPAWLVAIIIATWACDVSAFLVPRFSRSLSALINIAGTRPLTHVLLDAPGIARAIRERMSQAGLRPGKAA